MTYSEEFVFEYGKFYFEQKKNTQWTWASNWFSLSDVVKRYVQLKVHFFSQYQFRRPQEKVSHSADQSCWTDAALFTTQNLSTKRHKVVKKQLLKQ